jgi:hypothetical protein
MRADVRAAAEEVIKRAVAAASFLCSYLAGIWPPAETLYYTALLYYSYYCEC